MMDSITNVEPKRHYNPGLPLKIRLLILRCLPEFILDKLFIKEMPDISLIAKEEKSAISSARAGTY